VGLRAPTACSTPGTSRRHACRRLRLRRFDVPDGFRAPVIYAAIVRSIRSWGSPFEAFPSHFVPTRCRVQDESRASGVSLGSPGPLPTYRLRMCRPTNKSAVCRIRVGFWALLPLRVRQPPVDLLVPRTVRCSPGFCLSKDFALPAPSPFSRAFRSRACPFGSATAGAAPQRLALRRGQLSLAAVRGTTLRIVAVGMLPFLRFCARFSA